MAEESNVHIKVAMADVMALFVIAFFTFLVGGLGLGVFGLDQLAIIAEISVPVGILVLVATIIAYLNENVLGAAIFGPWQCSSWCSSSFRRMRLECLLWCTSDWSS